MNLTVGKGEFFSLLGPSGCGKSTLLRILAGLEPASAGEILWDGKRIDHLPARERPFNMVFQKYALFPHLSVFDNVAFGLRLKKVPSAELKSRVEEALSLVNLAGFGGRLPETLSGGQAQRVALARALVNRPACVLLDEPLTALDQQLREHMQTELRQLQRRLGLTFIFVTHDQEEAMLLSDRIAVMNQGVLEQVAEPRELFEAPGSAFCARFIGRRNELAATVLPGALAGADVAIEIAGGNRLQGKSLCRQLDARGSGPAQAFIRPERLKVIAAGERGTPGHNVVDGEIIQVIYRGTAAEVIVALPGQIFLRALTPASAHRSGDRVRVEFPPEETQVYMAEA